MVLCMAKVTLINLSCTSLLIRLAFLKSWVKEVLIRGVRSLFVPAKLKLDARVRKRARRKALLEVVICFIKNFYWVFVVCYFGRYMPKGMPMAWALRNRLISNKFFCEAFSVRPISNNRVSGFEQYLLV